MLAVFFGIRLEFNLIFFPERRAYFERVNAVKTYPVSKKLFVGRQIGGGQTVDFDRRQNHLTDFFF